MEDIHPEFVQSTVERPFICEVVTCRVPFSSVDNLDKHRERAHTKKPPAQPKPATSPTTTTAKRKKEPLAVDEMLICSQCGKTVSCIKRHNEECHTDVVKCPKCAKVFRNKNSLKVHMKRNHIGRILKCPICGKTVSDSYILRMHIQRHDNNVRHACDQCGKSYALKADLNYHVTAVHEGLPWRCEICGREFCRPADRNRHMRDVHGDGKNAAGNAGTTLAAEGTNLDLVGTEVNGVHL